MSSSDAKRITAIDGGTIAGTLTGVVSDSALVQAAINVGNLP